MIFERLLRRCGDDQDVFDTSADGLFDYVLDRGFVDDRKHLFGHGFGRWQETGSETGRRNHGLAYE